jgi:hypothetical protein
MTRILWDDDGPEHEDYDATFVAFDEHDPDDMRAKLLVLEAKSSQDFTEPLLAFSIAVLRQAIEAEEELRENSTARSFWPSWIVSRTRAEFAKS